MLDDASGWGQQINPFNYHLSRTLATFDVPANFVLSYHYSFPSLTCLARTAGRGMDPRRHYPLANGIPVTLSDSGDRSLLGTGTNGPGGAVDRPNCALGGDLQLAANDPRTHYRFSIRGSLAARRSDISGRARPASSMGRASTTGMRLFSDMRLTEHKVIQFRFEFFNAFNHTQFNNPSGSVTNANFGKVTSARSPRIAQVALKFLF